MRSLTNRCSWTLMLASLCLLKSLGPLHGVHFTPNSCCPIWWVLPSVCVFIHGKFGNCRHTVSEPTVWMIHQLRRTMLRVGGLLCSRQHARVVIGSGVYGGTSVRYFSDAPAVPRKASRRVDPASFRGKVKSYMELSKFRLSSLVVFTSGAGYVCAGLPFDYMTLAAVCSGTALCAASAGAFNQIFEITEDSQMKRTVQRPLPAGHISPTAAVAFGAGTGLAGTALLYTATNPVVAALGLANIGLYAGLYTYTKKHTELNTWIGSVVGAIPPVMGWAAATGGSIIAAEPAVLASILFLWQFPHFFALSYLHREDYARGGFQMVAVNDPTGQRSAKLIMEYSLYLAAVPIAASVGGLTSYMFALEGTAANLYLLHLARKFYQDRTNAGARRVFLCSLWYLPLLLAGFVFHSKIWDQQTIAETENADEVSTVLLCLFVCVAHEGVMGI